MSNRRIPITCKIHKIDYDGWDSQCPECQREYEAGSRILRRLTCQLCEQIKGSTKMYCGGPVGFLCDDCKRVLDKYRELNEAHKARWEDIKRVRSSKESANK